MTNELLSKEILIQDTKELIEYLCKRFNREKIYLVGHSWGSELGVRVIQNDSDRVAAFIGLGQVVDSFESEVISYKYIYDRAQREGNVDAINDLENFGEPTLENVNHQFFVQGIWSIRIKSTDRKRTQKGYIFAPEYSLMDGIRVIKGRKFSSEILWFQREMFDFRETYTKFDIPVYFCAGRYDFNTPFPLVEEYYQMIDAPKKNLYWFDESAHDPHLAEEEKFANIMLMIYEETREL